MAIVQIAAARLRETTPRARRRRHTIRALAPTLGKGDRFGDFEILEVAGRGGMGIVFRAMQVSLGRPVALKVISPEVSDQPDFRVRFERESRLAASIDHPNVVAVHGAGEIDELSYIAMQWIEGTNVADALEPGPLPLARTAAIGEQMANALDAAHATGLTHRDIKPGNILLRRIGSRDHAYLTDFGIAKRTEIDQGTDLTRAGSVVGTLNYMAPEQIEGNARSSSDLYALGCVLFEMATGHRPFERENDVAVMWAHMSGPRPQASKLRPELGGAFDAVIARALAIDPDERYGSGAELAEALRRAAAGVPLPPPTKEERAVAPPTVQAPPQAPPPPPSNLPPTAFEAPRPTAETARAPAGGSGDWTSRKGLIAAIAAVAVLAIGGVAYALVSSGGDGNDSGGGMASSGGDGGDGNGGASSGGGGSGGAKGNGKTDGKSGGQGSSGASDPAADRASIESVLGTYEDAYSATDLNGLSALLTDDVTRFGVVGGGCGTRTGRGDVIDAYAEQFAQNGPLAYTLVGVEPDAIDVNGDSASSSLGYQVGASSGTIDFGFERAAADDWLISDISANCG